MQVQSLVHVRGPFRLGTLRDSPFVALRMALRRPRCACAGGAISRLKESLPEAHVCAGTKPGAALYDMICIPAPRLGDARSRPDWILNKFA